MEESVFFRRPSIAHNSHLSELTTSIDETYAPLLVQIGFACLNMGRLREASTIFYATKSTWPHRLGPQIGLAVTCLQTKMYDTAIEILTKAQEMHEDDPAIEAFLGLTYFYKGELEKAESILQSIALKEYCIQDTSIFSMAANLLDEIQNKNKENKSVFPLFS